MGDRPTAAEIGAFLKRCDPRLVAEYAEDDMNLMVQILEVMNRPFPIKVERPRPVEVFIDCEWNGYKGSLISLAMVALDGRELYVGMPVREALDPWVRKHVMPALGHPEPIVGKLDLASRIAGFLKPYGAVHIVADWPEDIERICEAMVTGPGIRIETPPITLEIRRDIDSEDSAIPHNALEDARALKDHYLSLMADV